MNTTGDNSYEIQRRIDTVDAKIDKVDAKIDANAKEARSTLDAFTRIIEERWKAMELRYDLSDRQRQQSIELLTASVMKLEQSYSATDTNVALLGATVNNNKLALEETQRHQDEKLDAISENLRWIVRTLVVTILGVLTSVGIYVHPYIHG